MAKPNMPRNTFNPFALGLLVLFLLGLNQVIAHRYYPASIALQVLFTTWLVVGSAWLVWRRWKARKRF
ncbi:hypothetical protein [Dyella mobilis]|uniref:Uncharacterized protein n=1 Tax=Dyella mobilis TaxID=1849582 RepID=A0ABS2KJE6_9GAMM|nr:hypothetical protein [Dyella mobilis]MBM7131038.1 hypothetical protein [Dyella mobilis]GLQ97665.1 hypothetical protein GCM10007863_20850 [Dyella mobilis]